MPAAAAPFALQSQYVPAVLAARAGGDDGKGTSDDDDDCPPPKKKTKSRRQNGAPKEKSEPKVPKETGWDYSVVRKKFLAARKAEGKKYVEAVKLWDESMEKANYLGPCSVGELKKRRFLPPGSTDNPWFKKIHGPTN